MLEIKLSPKELREAILNGKLIGEGYYSSVFTYHKKLIKMDTDLYHNLKRHSNCSSEEIINTFYSWRVRDFNSRKQLEILLREQPYINPRVPEGIITLKDVEKKILGVSPGIIIEPFLNYQNLDEMPKTNCLQALILLRKIFTDLKTLTERRIAQEDLFRIEFSDDSRMTSKYNIIYRGNDAQIIDMSGDFIKIGRKYHGPDEMYRQFAEIIDEFYMANGFDQIYYGKTTYSEENLKSILNDFEKQMQKRKTYPKREK